MQVKFVPARGTNDPDIRHINYYQNGNRRHWVERAHEKRVKSCSGKIKQFAEAHAKSSQIDKHG